MLVYIYFMLNFSNCKSLLYLIYLKLARFAVASDWRC